MAQDGGISLRESRVPDGQQEPHDIEQSAVTIDQADSRQWETKRKRACVLLGSSILQLPIWGRPSPSSHLTLYLPLPTQALP